MILLTGASGTVGSEVARQLKEKGIPFRAMIRSPEKARQVDGPGVQIVYGDLAKPKSLIGVLEGVKKVFLLSPANPKMVQWQTNLIQAARDAGIDHIVRLSALGASLYSRLELMRMHAEAEQQLEWSSIHYTHLRPHFFMQNLFGFAESIRSTGAFYAPMGNGKISLVDVRDVAAVAVAALTGEGHFNQTYEITGPEALSFADIATILSETTDQKISYVDIQPDMARDGMIARGMSPWMASSLVDLMLVFAKGHASKVTDTVKKVTGSEARSFSQFAEAYAAMFYARDVLEGREEPLRPGLP